MSKSPDFKLTLRTVKALSSGPKREIYWDSELTGFGLRVMPSGAKVYFLKYRSLGRQRWFRIGRHGDPWTPEAARNEATRLLGEVAGGIDPAAGRDDARKGLTFRELVELYFAEGTAHKKPRTINSDRGRARIHLDPLLGPIRADAVTRGDIEKMLAAVVAGRTAKKPEKRRPGSVPTGGKGAGAQCVALASTIIEFAIKRGLCAHNPAKGVKKPAVRKLERFLTFDELARLADALDAEFAKSKAIHPIAAIRLLALTGCRRGEIVGLKWSEVDFQRRLLNLRDSKTREKRVYLSPAAIDVLSAIPIINRNPFVIAGEREGKASGAVDRTWERVRARAGLPDVRLHDLRHTFASIGAGASIGLPIIGRLLGHSQAATTARYAHLASDPVRLAADAIGTAIAGAMAKGKSAPLDADSLPNPSPEMGGRR